MEEKKINISKRIFSEKMLIKPLNEAIKDSISLIWMILLRLSINIES